MIAPLLAISSVAVSPLLGEGPWGRHVPITPSPPRIDGALSPGEWEGAAMIDNFTQVDPWEGAGPTERTVLYLMVDADNLYLGIRCYDSQPDAIIATQITRDADLDPDDRIELILDTFLDRRNAYFFQIGPGGSKGDALIANNGAFFGKDWDGIWEGRARRDGEGWSAEMALPAKTLSRKPGLDDWGFNLRRVVKRKNESMIWAFPERRTRLFNIASSGTLHGMSILDQGLGLDAVPFVSIQERRTHRSGDDTTQVEPGLDLRYKVSPSLTASLTVNTDFAETEVDNRVVNLSRFPVFFPEKRDFFLEDAGIFAFGGLGNDLVPFFSRRVGLSESGELVPIVVGAKLTGRVGKVSLGVLDVVTDSQRDVSSKNLAVARVAVNVLRESQLGAIVTVGDPATEGDNSLVGVDFSYRSRSFLGDRNLELDLFALGTSDKEAGSAGRRQREDGHAFGLTLEYPNDQVEARLGYQEVSEDFQPDLGFVRRRDFRRLFGRYRLEPRPSSGPVRRFTFGVHPDVFWSRSDGDIESASYRITLVEVLFNSADRIELELTPTEERLVEPFEIHEGVIIPPGVYRFDRWELELELADKRKVSGELELSRGTFFSGRRDSWEGRLTLRPVPSVTVEGELEHNDVALAEGSFATNLARLRLLFDFSPEVSWSTFIQYDDTSESIGLNSRVRWILEPGRDLFFVINRAYQTRDLADRFTLTPATTDLTLKASYTLRF